MNEEDLDAPRVQKLQARIKELQAAQEREGQKKALLLKVCSSEAYERLMNVRIAAPELYEQVVQVLLYLIQSKQLKGRIGEEQVLALLAKLTARKEGGITIKRKGD